MEHDDKRFNDTPLSPHATFRPTADLPSDALGSIAIASKTIRFDRWGARHWAPAIHIVRGVEVVLTTGGFDLLAALAKHSRRIFGREMLMDLTRGRGWEALEWTIDARVARLSKKIDR
ncbi:winged helix-turn-helix domain-containing protein [Methylovirgula sp. 4M-Z18]|uniref:winged helix-turn-helix domain-containing protein n=1 Tax=Methylovirgula sp. 4M-Z18 TaxID=2293567 RepID=UPI001FE0AD92|nr:winged helix-turn-helix domain-containing protein [Methylovirgula sp. 4M-Z18]